MITSAVSLCLMAVGKTLPTSELGSRNEEEFISALCEKATTRRQTNVLRHIAGHLRPHLDEDSRKELHALIENCRRGLVPLIVPVTLIRYFLHRFPIPYLRGQVYLEPHPKDIDAKKPCMKTVEGFRFRCAYARGRFWLKLASLG